LLECTFESGYLFCIFPNLDEDLTDLVQLLPGKQAEALLAMVIKKGSQSVHVPDADCHGFLA